MFRRKSRLREEIRLLADRAAIRDCELRYCRGLDRHDWDLLLSAFHEDAVERHPAPVSPIELVEQLKQRQAGWTNSLHHITNQTAEISGDSAHAETYFLALLKSAQNDIYMSSGRYISRYERRDGVWRIAARDVLLEATWNLRGTADNRGFSAGSQDRSDPSYRGLRADAGQMNS